MLLMRRWDHDQEKKCFCMWLTPYHPEGEKYGQGCTFSKEKQSRQTAIHSQHASTAAIYASLRLSHSYP